MAANDQDEADWERSTRLLAELVSDANPLDPADITGWALAVDTKPGVQLHFSGMDRVQAAVMFLAAAEIVLTVRGTSGRRDGAIPPMGADN